MCFLRSPVDYVKHSHSSRGSLIVFHRTEYWIPGTRQTKPPQTIRHRIEQNRKTPGSHIAWPPYPVAPRVHQGPHAAHRYQNQHKCFPEDEQGVGQPPDHSGVIGSIEIFSWANLCMTRFRSIVRVGSSGAKMTMTITSMCFRAVTVSRPM